MMLSLSLSFIIIYEFIAISITIIITIIVIIINIIVFDHVCYKTILGRINSCIIQATLSIPTHQI